MTRQIVFSHPYAKLGSLNANSYAELVEVIESKFESLSPNMKYWDTLYFENGKEFHYPLPQKGDCIILMFWAGFFFPTIRSSNPDKVKYYRGLIGKRLGLKI